jgi:hypothetical protein
MRRRCAWCGFDMGFKEPLDDDHITHGMCLRCSEKILRAAGQLAGASSRPRWQDQPDLNAPALVEKHLAAHTLLVPAETLHC